MESGLGELDASEAIGCTVAELEAVIRLSLLDDETLALVSNANSPMTTWLLLSEMSNEDVPKVLEAAAAIDDAQTDYQRMERAVRVVTGSPSFSAVQNLDPALFDFSLRKSEAYSVWAAGSQHYKELRKFATRRRSGKPLTPRQTAYASGLLRELVDREVIQVPSPDGDDDMSAAIIVAVR